MTAYAQMLQTGHRILLFVTEEDSFPDQTWLSGDGGTVIDNTLIAHLPQVILSLVYFS
jgi:hypothetical protein